MMAGKKKKRYFVALDHELLDSQAWRALTVHAWAAFICIKRKFNGKNGDNLSFTFEEAHQIMHRNTYAKVLNQLVDHGLIDIVKSGGLHNKPNIFSLSERWRKYGTDDFKKGKRYVPDNKW